MKMSVSLGMETEKITYIEESGLLFEKLGLTRMAGRVFGYLVVSEEDQASFDQIREVLQASKGSISGTMKQLLNAGMVEAVSLPGDRKTYYRPSKMKISDILKHRMSQFDDFARILSRGEELKTKKDDVSEWLIEASTFYLWVGEKLDEIIDKWESEKTKIIEEYRQNHEEKIES